MYISVLRKEIPKLKLKPCPLEEWLVYFTS